MSFPAHPKIYHISHVDNLPSILRDGFLYSETALRDRGGPDATIGMGHIKSRRLGMAVPCHPGTMVGEYVPFYFCPRSIMLYLIYKENHPEMSYHGGQDSILHFEFDFEELLSWADKTNNPWAITTTNAGAFYTQFFSVRSALERIDWKAVMANDWRDSDTREHKQAEFLVYEASPWNLVKRIGVHDNDMRDQIFCLLGDEQKALVKVLPEWYY